MTRPVAVLTDIEGTTTPIAYVHRVLFGYARRHLDAFVAARGSDPEVTACLDETRRLAPDSEPLAQLHAWMDADAKIAPLKTLQGLIWKQGYLSGELRAEMYADVPPALRRWQGQGVRLAVYSSGSAEAQRLIFGHAEAGDLSGLFEAFFDTAIGAKREAASYTAIAAALALPPGDILFLSDVGAELDAAAAAGLRTIQLARPEDATAPVDDHAVAADFDAVARLAGLG